MVIRQWQNTMSATSNECNNCTEFDGSAIDSSFAIDGKGSGLLGRSCGVHAYQFPLQFAGGMIFSVHAMVNPCYLSLFWIIFHCTQSSTCQHASAGSGLSGCQQPN